MALWTLKDRSFLVVDDFAEMRALVRAMLETLGACDVEQARGGREALERLEARRFDAVLCDYHLGDGPDGQQVLEEARIRGLLPRSSLFVMLTAENGYEMVMGAIEYAPDAYLSKPLTKAAFHARLRKLMNRRERLLPVTRLLDQRASDAALGQCDVLLADGGPYRADVLKLKADLLAKLGRLSEVIELCASVLAERPAPWALLARGNALMEQARFGPALAAYRQLADTSPSCVAAYDGIARAHEALGDDPAAQEALMEGVRRSPKSLSRQRSLGTVALRNEDWPVCESARRQAVRVGKFSAFKRARDYTGLADVLLRKDAKDEALRTVRAIRYVFRGDELAEMEGAVAEIGIQVALGKPAAARAARERALAVAARSPARVPARLGLDLVRACLGDREPDAAHALAVELVRNHHDDEGLLAALCDAFREAGTGDEGEALIARARAEAAEMNDRAIELAEAGKIEESCALFEEAVARMPGNCTLSLNAARSLVLWMQRHGVDRSRLARVLDYLEVVRDEPRYRERHHRIRAMLLRVASLDGAETRRPEPLPPKWRGGPR